MATAQLMVQDRNERGKLHGIPVAVTNDGVLPTDALYEVMLRLPVDVLCRFRLVCRSWRSLTSDPTFAKAHSSRRHPLVIGFGSMVTGPARRHTRDIMLADLSGNIVKRISMEQAWDGSELSVDHGLCILQKEENACVVNPATGAITVVPAPSIPTKYENMSFLVFFTYVIGQVPSTGEYKVLRIHHYLGNQDGQTYNVMALGSNGDNDEYVGRWRVMPRPPIQIAMGRMHKAVVKGVAYFLSISFLSDDIASFDFATEEWRHATLHGPLGSDVINAKDNDRLCLKLANLNGCLVTICLYSRGNYYDHSSIDLWFLMDVDKGLWTKRYSLECPPIHYPDGLVSPLGILDDEKILLWAQGTRELRAYDQRTTISTTLSTIKGIAEVGIYQGSLLCSDIWTEPR